MTDLERARWTTEQLDDLKAELCRRHLLDPLWRECADAIGSLQFDLVDARRETAEMRERAAQVADSASELMADSDIQFGSISGVATDLAKDLTDAIRALPLTEEPTPGQREEAKAHPK